MKQLFRWLLILPLSLFLFAALFYGNGEKIHARLLVLGENLFPGYFALQSDLKEPNCDVKIEAPKDEPAVKDDLDALIEGDDAAPKDQNELPSNQKKEAPKDELDVLIDGDDAQGDGGTQDAQKVQAQAQALQEAKLKALAAAQKICDEQKAQYLANKDKITPELKAFRSIEKGVGAFVSWMVDHFKHILVMIMLLGTLTASLKGHHIALRNPEDQLSLRLSEGLQAITFIFVMAAMYAHREQLSQDELWLNMVWLIGLGILIFVHLFRLIVGNSSLAKYPKSWILPFLSIPLYATMSIITGLFFLKIGHHKGIAIHMTKLTEHAILYVHVALYVWIGMLLKQSPLNVRIFDFVRPWHFAPSLLTVVVVIFAAIPTAYSGASGIFVIAVGGLIYQELVKAGASRQMALGATAMSGSMGVVLNPCLLVVIIASLNKKVTTDELYDWGFKVFLLTAVLFTLVTFSKHDRSIPLIGADRNVAWQGTKDAMKRIMPALVMILIVVLFYAFVLNSYIDEHSAPMILPVILLMLLALSHFKKEIPSLGHSITEATEESGTHIGALLMLMTFSVCIGGVIEETALMSLFPSVFSSTWLTMSALVVVLIFIGMVMDPYGAVILVSATITQIADQNNIHPIHFWVTVMVAFELGYLTPPVALNHLLTRQVVGGSEVDLADSEGNGFWQKNERIISPVIVMGVALLIVAFIPLFFY